MWFFRASDLAMQYIMLESLIKGNFLWLFLHMLNATASIYGALQVDISGAGFNFNISPWAAYVKLGVPKLSLWLLI